MKCKFQAKLTRGRLHQRGLAQKSKILSKSMNY